MPAREVHVQVGSSLHLECHISGCTHPVPAWTHAGRPLPENEIKEYKIEEDPSAALEIDIDGKNSTSTASSTDGEEDSEADGNEDEKEDGKLEGKTKYKQKTSSLMMSLGPRHDSGAIAMADDPSAAEGTKDEEFAQNFPDGPIGGAGIDVFSTTAPTSMPYMTIVSVTRKGVTPQHSGIYTCTSTCTPPVNVTVHVLRGMYYHV